MLSKKYADADFFLALMKDSDWLKEKAKKIINSHKGNIWVTPFTVTELMIVCKREDIPVRETLFQISRIAKLEMVPVEIFFQAVSYMGKGATIFDSLFMAFCEGNSIISSDKIYKRFGFDVIDLRG